MTTRPAAESTGGNSTRRDELLALAAGLFAERGLRATTVRDIADAAGILSGSLYHHFESKEAIVDEILRGVLDTLFSDYQQIVERKNDARSALEEMVRVSFRTIDNQRDAVAIYQDEVKHLRGNPRFAYLGQRNTEFRAMWIGVLERGMQEGAFRSDLDVALTYRFLRDTVWVAVRWYRPGGDVEHAVVADQYLHIVLDGLSLPPHSE